MKTFSMNHELDLYKFSFFSHPTSPLTIPLLLLIFCLAVLISIHTLSSLWQDYIRTFPMKTYRSIFHFYSPLAYSSHPLPLPPAPPAFFRGFGDVAQSAAVRATHPDQRCSFISFIVGNNRKIQKSIIAIKVNR